MTNFLASVLFHHGCPLCCRSVRSRRSRTFFLEPARRLTRAASGPGHAVTERATPPSEPRAGDPRRDSDRRRSSCQCSRPQGRGHRNAWSSASPSRRRSILSDSNCPGRAPAPSQSPRVRVGRVLLGAQPEAVSASGNVRLGSVSGRLGHGLEQWGPAFGLTRRRAACSGSRGQPGRGRPVTRTRRLGVCGPGCAPGRCTGRRAFKPFQAPSFSSPFKRRAFKRLRGPWLGFSGQRILADCARACNPVFRSRPFDVGHLLDRDRLRVGRGNRHRASELRGHVRRPTRIPDL